MMPVFSLRHFLRHTPNFSLSLLLSRKRSIVPAHRESVNQYFLAKYGVALHGPDLNTLIPPLDLHEVRKASARGLFKEWKPKINDTKWLANSHYQSYLVLNLCRIL